MIIKITRGVSAANALAYDYGPGKANEHHQPRRVNGTVAGRDWRARSRAMQTQLRDAGDARKGGQKRVYRLACRAAPGDRIMSDREWGAIAHQVVDQFTGGRADQHSWEVVRHAKDHVHVTLLQRGHDGKLCASRNDHFRAGRIAAQIERDHDLTRVDHTPVRGDPVRRKQIRKATRDAREAWRTGVRSARRAAELSGPERRIAPDSEREAPRSLAAPPPTRDERLAAARLEAERRAAERERQRQQDRERGRGR